MLENTNKKQCYATGILSRPGNADRIVRQHLAFFWRVPVVEGRTTAQGHLIDADELLDPFEEMDIVDQYEPEAQGGRVLAQHGEFLHQEVEFESPCVTCSNVWCSGVLEGMCRGEVEAVTERRIP